MILSALGATEGAKNSFDFATKIGIRIAGLKEVRKLRRLIVHAVNRLDDGSCSLDQKVDSNVKLVLTRICTKPPLWLFSKNIYFQISQFKTFQLPKPTEEQIRLLTELFVTGFGDQIARRNGQSDQYNILSMTDSVKIHPNSGKT